MQSVRLARRQKRIRCFPRRTNIGIVFLLLAAPEYGERIPGVFDRRMLRLASTRYEYSNEMLRSVDTRFSPLIFHRLTSRENRPSPDLNTSLPYPRTELPLAHKCK